MFFPGPAALHEHGHDGDGKHAEGGGEEDGLGHETFVLVVFEAEHDAIDADGHTAEDDGYLHGENLYSEEGEDSPYDGGDDEETDEAGGIGETAAEHGALGHRGEGAADDKKGDGDGHIADEMEEAAYQGRCGQFPEGEDDSQHGGNDAGREDALGFDGAFHAASADKHLADGVHQEVEGDGQYGGIEEGTLTENGGNSGKTDEGDIAEGGHELQLATHVFVLLAPHAADEVGEGEDDRIVDDCHPHDAGDFIAFEDEAVAHDARKDKHGC